MSQHQQHLPLYVLAGASVLAGAIIAGVPAASLLAFAAPAGCLLMMVFMMKGMHGGSSEPHQQAHPVEQPAEIRLDKDLR